MSKNVKTMPGVTYAVTMTQAGTVQAKMPNGTLMPLVQVSEAGQTAFLAISVVTVVSDEGAVVLPFSGAAMTVLGGGGKASGGGVTQEAFAAHAGKIATTTEAGHLRVGGVGVTAENGQLRIKFRSEHSGFEVDGDNAVYANTGTNDHPAHGAIAPVATDSAGKFCVPFLTLEKTALLEVLLSNKDALLAAIGATEEEAAAITEAAEAMTIAEALAAEEAAKDNEDETSPETNEHTYEFEL